MELLVNVDLGLVEDVSPGFVSREIPLQTLSQMSFLSRSFKIDLDLFVLPRNASYELAFDNEVAFAKNSALVT